MEILKETNSQIKPNNVAMNSDRAMAGTVAELFKYTDEEFDFVGPEEEKGRDFEEGPQKVIAVSELRMFFPEITTTQGLNLRIKDDGIEPVKVGRNNYLTSNDVRRLFQKNNIVDYSSFNRSISIIATKGGVGKTTTSINLATRLAQYGFKVCLVDMDAQCNATQGLGVPDDLEGVFYNVISDEKEYKDVCLDDIILKVSPNLHLIPSGPDNTLLESYLALRVPRIDIAFKKIADELKSKYEIVIFDCSPSLGITNSGVLLASDEILIPMTPGSYSYKSVGKTLRWIRDVVSQYEADLSKKIRVFINMYEDRKNISRSYLVHAGTEKLLKNYNTSTYIPLGETVKQQSEEFLSVFETNKDARIKERFVSLVHEIIGLKGDF